MADIENKTDKAAADLGIDRLETLFTGAPAIRGLLFPLLTSLSR